MIIQRTRLACRYVWQWPCLVAVASVALANPVPFVNQPLVPASVAPGGAAFMLTVNGTGFVSGSVVNWNGSPRATTFVNASRLTAMILSADIAAPGTGTVTVVNPAPGGGVSEAVCLPDTIPTASVTIELASGGECGNFSVAGDFNGDGILDVALSQNCASSGDVAVMLGIGNGTFQNPVDYFLGDRVQPSAIALGDFNGDGKPDLVVGVLTSNGYALDTLLGNGDGTFQSPLTKTLSIQPAFLQPADFNRDGKLDLGILDLYSGAVVMLGNGDGTFQPGVAVGGSGGQFGTMGIGDFNGDGVLDLALIDGSNAILVALGNGDGTFRNGNSYTVGSEPIAVVAADFNGDGKQDLAVTNFGASSDSISVLLGNGDGTFQKQVNYPTTFGPYAIVAGDFNGDGNVDLAIGNNAAPVGVSILLGNGDGTFQPSASLSGSDAATIVAGDFNGDGRLDLLYGSYVLLQAPAVKVSAASLAFGNQSVGIASAAQAVVVTNTGSVAFTISGISIGGSDASDFGQSNNCIGTLAPAANCTINVTFTPTATGARTAPVVITDNAPGGPQTIDLTGTGVAPSVSLSSKHLQFATQLVDSASPAMPLVVTNTGTAPLAISRIATTGPFSEANACASIAIGASCTINLVFTPTGKGAQTGTVTISDNAAGSPQTVALSGTGTWVNFSAKRLDLGTERVGKRTHPATVTVSNEGRKTLSISGVAITGTDGGDFAETTTCPASLAPRKSCSITVTFTPLATGSRHAKLSVTDDGGGSPQDVALTGTGT